MSRENKKLLPHLASCVDDICCEFLALVLDDFAESIFNRWVIALHEMSVDELDRQGGFACNAIVRTCEVCKGINRAINQLSASPQWQSSVALVEPAF